MKTMQTTAPITAVPALHSPQPPASDLPPSAAEEARLCHLARQGDSAAHERLILANLRLVNAIARAFEGRGLAFEDLTAEGTIGLIRAVDVHDPEIGTRLTTYAAMLIKQHIIQALNRQSRIVRLPGNVLEKLRLIERITAMETAATGRPPTDAELAEITGISPEKIAELRRHNRVTVSLDHAFDEGESGTLHDMVDDPVDDIADEAVAAADMRARILRVLARLEVREQRILRARFGFGDGKTRTLEEVSRMFGLTRERIRQIQDLALGKMRLALAS
jgi:RNA polymerase sigma factor (sigma-70 family)